MILCVRNAGSFQFFALGYICAFQMWAFHWTDCCGELEFYLLRETKPTWMWW